jgi:hypothetical protein
VEKTEADQAAKQEANEEARLELEEKDKGLQAAKEADTAKPQIKKIWVWLRKVKERKRKGGADAETGGEKRVQVEE